MFLKNSLYQTILIDSVYALKIDKGEHDDFLNFSTVTRYGFSHSHLGLSGRWWNVKKTNNPKEILLETYLINPKKLQLYPDTDINEVRTILSLREFNCFEISKVEIKDDNLLKKDLAK